MDIPASPHLVISIHQIVQHALHQLVRVTYVTILGNGIRHQLRVVERREKANVRTVFIEYRLIGSKDIIHFQVGGCITKHAINVTYPL